MENLLPFDGVANYYGKTVASPERFLKILMAGIDWKQDEVVLFGKRIITKRKTAWYGDRAFAYTYSGATKIALPWTAELLELKNLAEEVSGERYNCCLLNLYHDGSESMGWHADDEKTIARDSAIATLSFGAERRFLLRHKTTKETIPVTLENGSLLVMKGETQRHWLHSIPKSMKVLEPRISLTFRKFVE